MAVQYIQRGGGGGGGGHNKNAITDQIQTWWSSQLYLSLSDFAI